MEELTAWLRRNFGTDRPQFHSNGRWTYSGDWINGPFITGEDPIPADVHEQWERVRDAP